MKVLLASMILVISIFARAQEKSAELTDVQKRALEQRAKLEVQIGQVISRNKPFPYLKFANACAAEEDIQILAVGDILLHGTLQTQATKHPQRYKSLWSSVIPLLEGADISYANLEGPVAENTIVGGATVPDVGFKYDDVVYTSFPRFNYHNYLVEDIKASGFDVVSAANNHTLDRTYTGLDKTIQALTAAELPFTGVRSSKTGATEQFYRVLTVKNKRIAWLACTFSTNGGKDPFKQVLQCFKDKELVLEIISKLSKNPEIDAVIVTPHWGNEYELTQTKEQTQLGRQMIEAGAIAVLGTHPHVIQPWEKYTTQNGREGFIVYSTGNFVSGQSIPSQRTSLMVSLHLTGQAGRKLEIRGVQYVPLLMNRSPYSVIDIRKKLIEKPESLPADTVTIFKQFDIKNMMTQDRQKALEQICDLSK